jgi:ssDNA-binding Zn-finger/Zn-ribbon topoisomerase 1
MIKFKGCPKCGGDLQLGEDMYGKFVNCLQCGYLKDVLPEGLKAPKQPQPVATGGERKAA